MFVRAASSLVSLPDDRMSAYQNIFARLYAFFDEQGDERVIANELTTALVMLINATDMEKLGLGFLLIDGDRDGFLERSELMSFMSSTLKLVLGLSSSTAPDAEVFLAIQQTSELHSANVFELADQDQV